MEVLSEAERLTAAAEVAIAEIDRMIGTNSGRTSAMYARRLQTVQGPLREWRAFIAEHEAALIADESPQGTALRDRFDVLFTRLTAAADWLAQEGA